MEKFGEIILFFGEFFGAFFRTFFGAFFGEQLFASKSEKFVQNPFCKRDPLTNCAPNLCKNSSCTGMLRKGAPFHGFEKLTGDKSSECKLSSKLRGDKTASLRKEMNGREVTGR